MTSVCYVHGPAELKLDIGQVIARSSIIMVHLYTSISITMTQEELRLGRIAHEYDLYLLLTLS
jgi:hypothetical protein